MTQRANDRLPQLDALRGVAALSVGLSHHLTVFVGSPHATIVAAANVVKWSPLYPFAAGYESVVLFFVLSGFVLTLPHLNARHDPYAIFAIRRVLRLYPPYFGSVMLAAALSRWLFRYVPADVGPWFRMHWIGPPTAKVLMDHTLMVHHFDTGQLNPVFWSLVVEMRVSLLFPLVALLALRLPTRLSILSVAICTLIRIVGARIFHGSVATDVLFNVEYFGMFVVGGILARHHKELVARVGRMSSRHALLLVLVGWLAYAYGRAATHMLEPIGDWPIMGGACVLILFATGLPLGKAILDHSAARFLGRISYSYYLIHVLVLFGLARALNGRVATPFVAAISLPLGVFAASVFYRMIEQPSIDAGRRASAFLRTRFASE
jgi:peptidoglycan/LPS O-acetylase OafA/YrhL